jgi:hypothetical protein
MDPKFDPVLSFLQKDFLTAQNRNFTVLNTALTMQNAR